MTFLPKLDLPALIFLFAASFTALFFILIIGFLVYTAAPVLQMEGFHFITGTVWDYETHQYGIFFFLVGTIITTLVTILIAVPISVSTAIYLAEWSSPRIREIMKSMIELLVGIPSVVYGIFGYFILSDIFRDHIDPAINSMFGFIPIFRDVNPGSGSSILLASFVLAIMIIPIIVAISYDALRSVSWESKEGSYALGTTKWETIKRIVLPAAFTSIVTATILGMMRAMGETMAVVMLSGNSAHIPVSILDSTYMMTSKILNDIGFYSAAPEPRSALYAIAVLLFLLEIFFVGLTRLICSRFGDKTA